MDANEDKEMTEDSEAEKKQLLSDINELRQLIKHAELQLSALRFGDIDIPDSFISEPETVQRRNKLINVGRTIKDEIQAFAGVRCRKINNGLVFSFQSMDPKKGFNMLHYVEMYKDSVEKWRLGNWVLPMSVDVNAILAEYPIETPGSIKRFLKECKYRIDCYNRRKEQFYELREFLNTLDLYNSYNESNIDFTRFTIKLAKDSSLMPDDPRSIVVYLVYKRNEARPTKIIIESDDIDAELSNDDAKKMKHLFKYFKELDPKDAAAKIFESVETRSLWRRKLQNDSAILNADVEEEMETMRSVDHSDETSIAYYQKRKLVDKKKMITDGKKKRVRKEPTVSKVNTKKVSADVQSSYRNDDHEYANPAKKMKKNITTGIRNPGKGKRSLNHGQTDISKFLSKINIEAESSNDSRKINNLKGPKRIDNEEKLNKRKDPVRVKRNWQSSTPITERVRARSSAKMMDEISEISMLDESIEQPRDLRYEKNHYGNTRAGKKINRKKVEENEKEEEDEEEDNEEDEDENEKRERMKLLKDLKKTVHFKENVNNKMATKKLKWRSGAIKSRGPRVTTKSSKKK